MTFTTSLKEEIAKKNLNVTEENAELLAFLLAIGKFTNKTLTITSENASVIRRIYKNLKEYKIFEYFFIFNINYTYKML